jgi:hypothetical protein
MIAEFSATLATNNGSFYVGNGTSSGAGAAYNFASKGTVSVNATSPSTFASPITNILTGIGDIAGDNATFRVNSAQVATTTTDQGTGNYLAYPLFIGARGGSSVFFSGHLYGLIARFGPNLATGQISSTETWVAGKTGITI